MRPSFISLLCLVPAVLGLPAILSGDNGGDASERQLQRGQPLQALQQPTENVNAPVAQTNDTAAEVKGVTLAAQPADTVPEGAANYISPTGKVFNMHHFNMFVKSEAKNPTKWIRVEPAKYTMVVDQSADGYNQDIEIDGLRGEGNEGWTIDFRGSTFYYSDDIKETPGNPVGAIYIVQCNRLTVLGGTVWINAGELYSQGVIKSKTMAPDANGNDAINIVTIVVDEGYDLDSWNKLDYQMGVIDARDSAHYTRINMQRKCWGTPCVKVNNIDKDTRTVTAWMNAAGFEEGMHMSVGTGKRTQPVAVSAEMNSDLVVKGMTTNGKFDQYGLHDHELEGTINKPESFVDCMVVNLPLKEGIAPRVNGPTMFPQWPGWYNNDNQAENPNFEGSMWQVTGKSNDMLSMSVTEPPFGSEDSSSEKSTTDALEQPTTPEY